ncbi:MAG: hypothetical protein P8182_17120 [Deltaproteobacteria bacterium]
MRNSLVARMVTIAVILFAAGLLIAFSCSNARAQSGTKIPGKQETTSTLDQGKAKVRTMMIEGHSKLMEGTKMARQAVKMLKQQGDEKKAEKMLADAGTLLVQGDQLLMKAQRLMKKSKELKQSMKPMMECCKKMMQGSKIVRSGMIMTKDKTKMSDAERMTKEGHKIIESEGKKFAGQQPAAETK